MQKLDHSTDNFIDPVCWNTVPYGRNNHMATHLMRFYYFCSEDCRKAFEINPDRYLKLNSSWSYDWWKLYFKRLVTAVNG